MQRFVIVTFPRSGSYHLTSLLDSASDIRCYGEVFKGSAVEIPKESLSLMGLDRLTVSERDAIGGKLLDPLFATSGHPIQGFKAFPDQLERAELHKMETGTQWKYIFLQRNPVETYVSWQRAKQTGLYVLNQGENSDLETRNLPVKVELEELRKNIEWREKSFLNWRHKARKLGSEKALTVDYRWLHRERRLQKILNFLGSSCSARSLVSFRQKQFTKKFSEGVENFTEVVDLLSDLGREDLLNGLE